MLCLVLCRVAVVPLVNMEAELLDDWKRLSLTEAEDEVIKFVSDDTENVQAQVSLCLVGKLHTTSVFNLEALKQTMKNIWRPSHGLVMTDLDQNLFALQFFSIGDKEYVLEEGPWAFDGHILLLKELDPNVQPSKIEFNTTRFWIKIYDLPMSWRNRKFAEHIGNKIGAFVDVDQLELLIPSKALKIRIDCDLHKPLRRGLMLKVNGESTWFKMKYHKLLDFCYACGMLGHIYRRCNHYDTDIPESKRRPKNSKRKFYKKARNF